MCRLSSIFSTCENVHTISKIVFWSFCLFVHTNFSLHQSASANEPIHTNPPDSCQLLFSRSNSTTSHFLSRQSARLKAVRFGLLSQTKFHSLEICINLHHSSKSKEGHVLYHSSKKGHLRFLPMLVLLLVLLSSSIQLQILS